MNKVKDNVDFTEEHFKNWNLRVHSHEVFPEYSNLSLPNESGKNYELIEGYCKNFECECTIIGCIFIEEGNKNNPILFDYDYISRKCVKGNIPDFAIETFALDDFNTVFKLKHTIIKKNFSIAILEKQTNELSLLNKKKRELSKRLADANKLNRNDTCFCGSGKKYKKCCLNL